MSNHHAGRWTPCPLCTHSVRDIRQHLSSTAHTMEEVAELARYIVAIDGANVRTILDARRRRAA